MTAYTQKYMALVKAPWLAEPQTQFATFTFDDATSAQFPTWATVREELARRSAFADTDATTTNDTWGSGAGDMPKALEVDRLNILYLAEFNEHQALGTIAPPNLNKTTDYVWPAVGTSGLNTNMAGLTTLTCAADDLLAGNSADTDDTPPMVASITWVAAAASAKAAQAGDAVVAVLNGAEIYNQALVTDAVDSYDAATADLASVTAADVYTIQYFVRKANGATSRILTRTHTNS